MEDNRERRKGTLLKIWGVLAVIAVVLAVVLAVVTVVPAVIAVVLALFIVVHSTFFGYNTSDTVLVLCSLNIAKKKRSGF